MHQLDKPRLVATWQAVWDRGEVDALDAIVSPDYVRVA
jgi:hypothetical protein